MALAKWYKMDFHTHTPESSCFPNKGITPEQWLEAAKGTGVNAVVVCDHNSVGYISQIEKVKEQYEEDDVFKVFYGIELCVSAEFTHIIVIFDDKMTVMEIEDAVISCLELKRDKWANTEVNVSEDKLKKLCEEYKNRIFVIPAHFASNKGLGTCNINAIKKYQEFVKFSAIEVRNEKDVSAYENKLKCGAINEAVLITGSDNPSNRDETKHSIEGFAKEYTWIKLSKLSFDGLKQVFIDPENRCIDWVKLQSIGKDFNPNEVSFNYISGVKFAGIKHMTDFDMRLSPHLNCIVGGRGTGKSTIMNVLNYGVNNENDLSKCTLLDKTLDKDGSISTFFNFGSNKEYRIDVKREKRSTIANVYDDSGFVENPPEFKVDFYGQKEIYNLVEEDNDINTQGTSPLIKMIDEKVKTELYDCEDSIDTALSDLLELSTKYKNNQKKTKELPGIKAEIEKGESILKKFQASGIEKARLEYEQVDSQIKAIEKMLLAEKSTLLNSAEKYESLISGIDDKLSEILEYANYNKEGIKLLDSLKTINEEVIEYLNKKSDDVEKIQGVFSSSDIYGELEEKHSVYLEALGEVRNTGGEDIDLIQNQLQQNKNRFDELSKLQNQQAELVKKIDESIDSFIERRLDLSSKRKEIIDGLKLDSIKLELIPLGHHSRWKANLQKECGKEGTFEEDFKKLSELVLSEDDNFLQYKKFIKFLLIDETGNIERVGMKGYDSRFANIWIDKKNHDTLNSLVKLIPEDKLNIKIVEESREIDINDGSPGQKCAAILAFILNSGDNPLIIDQPEDDLDNSLIYSLIVKSIRRMKTKRQIIVVTHNPNIPVLGDAEGIIILDRNEKGKVAFRKEKKAGCIEEKLIREGICEIMEGGEQAFRKREEKYLSNI